MMEPMRACAPTDEVIASASIKASGSLWIIVAVVYPGAGFLLTSLRGFDIVWPAFSHNQTTKETCL